MASDVRPGWPLLRALLAPHRRKVAIVGALAFLGGLVEAVLLVLVARLALTLSEGADVVSLEPVSSAEVSVGVLLGVTVVLPLIRLGLTTVVSWRIADLVTQVMADTRLQLLRAFLDASWATQSRERLGRLQDLLTTSSWQVLLALRWMVQGLEAVLVLGALLVAALVVNLVGSLAVGGAVVVLTFVLQPVRASVQRRSRRAASVSRDFAMALTEHTTLAREIRIFGVEDVVAEQVGEVVHEHRRTLRRSLLVEQLAPGMYQSLALLLIALTLVFIRVAEVDDLAAFAAVVLLMVRSLSQGQTLQAAIQAVNQATPHLEALQDHAGELTAAAVRRSGRDIERIDEIAFDHVTFGYEPDRPVLSDASFTARRGELIGVVGPSGSGKSTLVQLLLRLREPDAGAVLADGRPVDEVSLGSWYRRVGLAPQEPVLLTGTVAENIAFFRPTDQASLERAARLAQLHDDVVGWPEGYETPVGERGAELSGGQRQRLCLARALLGDPDVLVFDEPTSALDSRSEAAFRQVIEERSADAVVFVVAHRLSTLRTCDRIMVVRDGGIEAVDDPAALEASSPFFRELLAHADLRST